MSMTPNSTLERLEGYGLAAFAAICWATGGLVAKWLLAPLDPATANWFVPPTGYEFDPVVLAGARAIGASVILVAYLALRRPYTLRVKFADLWFLAFFGVFGLAAVHLTYFQTIDHTDVATAILLQYLAPIIVLIVSVTLLGERFTWALPAGVALALLGCALVVGVLAGEGVTIGRAGLMWGLASAVFFAMYSLLGRHGVKSFGSWTLLAYGFSFAAIFWLVYLGGASKVIDLILAPFGAVALLYLVVFATILPFAAFLKALQLIGATKTIVTSTIEPVVAGTAAIWLFAESFTGPQILGALLVLAAVAVIQLQAGPGAAQEIQPPGS